MSCATREEATETLCICSQAPRLVAVKPAIEGAGDVVTRPRPARLVRRDRAIRDGIPEATVSRLPLYLQALTTLAEDGVDTVSSEELAAAAGVGSAKLRKDLSHLGSYGTRGVGYEVEYLVNQISRELGLTHANASYHLRNLLAGGLILVAGEEKIRGGVAKRYRYDPVHDREDRACGDVRLRGFRAGMRTGRCDRCGGGERGGEFPQSFRRYVLALTGERLVVVSVLKNGTARIVASFPRTEATRLVVVQEATPDRSVYLIDVHGPEGEYHLYSQGSGDAASEPRTSFSLAPPLRGEDWGEGLYQQTLTPVD